jgi:uncharacterized protein
MLIEMKVSGLAMDPMTELPIVILKDRDDKNPLPIWIGLIEASSIATVLENLELSRPMTHDLMKNLLDVLGIQVLQIEITDLRGNTYYASIVLQNGSQVVHVDARPSDAIALALRVGCPILVEEDAVRKAREVNLQARPIRPTKLDEDSIRDYLLTLPEEDFGKWKM